MDIYLKKRAHGCVIAYSSGQLCLSWHLSSIERIYGGPAIGSHRSACHDRPLWVEWTTGASASGSNPAKSGTSAQRNACREAAICGLR